MSKRTKVIESNIQPNPKEAEIWAKVNEDGSREIKQYNSSTGKFECCGGSGSGSGSNVKHFTFYNWSGGNYNGDDETLTTKKAFTFEFEEGMTWQDWINSKYNTLGMSFFEDSDYVKGKVFLMIRYENGDMPLSVITISLDPQNEFGSNAIQTDEIIPNDYFVYSGCPTAF